MIGETEPIVLISRVSEQQHFLRRENSNVYRVGIDVTFNVTYCAFIVFVYGTERFPVLGGASIVIRKFFHLISFVSTKKKYEAIVMQICNKRNPISMLSIFKIRYWIHNNHFWLEFCIVSAIDAFFLKNSANLLLVVVRGRGWGRNRKQWERSPNKLRVSSPPLSSRK